MLTRLLYFSISGFVSVLCPELLSLHPPALAIFLTA